jgi:limonene-1,2-epoxide hydrolase
VSPREGNEEDAALGAHLHASPKEIVDRLHRAMNQHDLAGFLACFGPDYRSEQPTHPNRVFGGREQVEKNWAALFAGMPDFHAELVATAADGDTVWAEWRWSGTRAGESSLDMSGVTIFGVADGLIEWGRFYMEEVEAAGEDIDETVRRLAGPDRPAS